ncbi:MAG: dihydroorotate dehydrogenase [Candidatus Omnitrophota bacterium]
MGLKIRIGNITLKNPVMAASGTFGMGEEYSGLMDINKLGAIVTKTITLLPRAGNPAPRLVETPSGLLNSIGLENGGVDDFLKNKMPFIRKLKVPVIVSIGAEDVDEYAKLAEKLDRQGVAGIEINISCPNVRTGLQFGKTPEGVSAVVSAVRKATKRTIITKLTPNVSDITQVAKAAQDAGSDAVSLVNTFLGMAVDIDSGKPLLGAVTGGLSGPAIKPMALRMVWEAHKKIKIPIIGIGGIMSYRDAIEFIICGASAVQIGTANFVDPRIGPEIIDGIGRYLKKKRINDINKLTGTLKVKK